MSFNDHDPSIERLATSALWYAWGQIDPAPGETAANHPLRQRGFDTEHGQEFQRLYEQFAKDYRDGKRYGRSSVLDAFAEFVRSKDRLGINAKLTVDDIDRSVRFDRELVERKAEA
jgi:hypothetical protein